MNTLDKYSIIKINQSINFILINHALFDEYFVLNYFTNIVSNQPSCLVLLLG